MSRNQDKQPLYRPRHGGDIQNAAKEFGGKVEDWLDLSTGISPWVYPVPKIDETIWRQLPGGMDELISVAAAYYQCQESALCPTPGSQLAIRLLPSLISLKSTVAIPAIGYQEHAFAWEQAGHQVVRYSSIDQLAELVEKEQVNNAVVINPNNPTCHCVPVADLLTLSGKLSGILLVDEAFADLDNSQSLASELSGSLNNSSFNYEKSASNIIVLRSLGKFFGLAGARLGFVISQHRLAKQLNELLSPWSINAPALHLAEKALGDLAWQTMQKRRIGEQNRELAKLLHQHLDIETPSTDKEAKHNVSRTQLSYQTQGLFSTLTGSSDHIIRLHKKLAAQRIWTRLGDDFHDENRVTLNWLRLSLPGNRLAILAKALSTLNN